MAAAVAGIRATRAIPPPSEHLRELTLPRDLGVLAPLVARARDARDLYRALAGRGVTGFAVIAPCDPPPAWSPIAADIYLDFWARHTRAGRTDETGARRWRLVHGPERRPLGLDEPPGLVEWLADGNRELARRHPREALAAFAAAGGRVAGLPALFAGLATAHARLGEFDRAERAMAMAIQRGGLHPDHFDALGRIMAEAGRTTDAARAYEQAAGLDPDNAARWRTAAAACLAAGLDEAAARCDARARDLAR